MTTAIIHLCEHHIFGEYFANCDCGINSFDSPECSIDGCFSPANHTAKVELDWLVDDAVSKVVLKK